MYAYTIHRRSNRIVIVIMSSIVVVYLVLSKTSFINVIHVHFLGYLGFFVVYEMTSLSLSTMLSERSRSTDWTIRPSVPLTWIPDERVKRCFGCGSTFSTFRRKHHCRSCGRIFCSACTAYREVIPSYFQTFSGVFPNTPQRTCAPCAQTLHRASEVEHLIRMISVLPVLMSDLFGLRLVNKQWNHATNTMFSLFRGLQYKLSCQPYSNIERDFLVTHLKEFNGHVPWVVHALAAAPKRSAACMNGAKLMHRVQCRKLLCSRTCRPTLSVEDILRLGMAQCLDQMPMQHWVIDAWRVSDKTALCKMMPWWVYLACRCTKLFRHGLIPIALESLDVMYALWFECELQKSPRFERVLQRVQKETTAALEPAVRQQFIASRNLVRCFKNILKAPSKEGRSQVVNMFFKDNGPARLPWNAQIVVTNMSVIKQLQSSSNPLVVRLTAGTGDCHTLLLKQEDVRTDRLAMVVGYWTNHLTTDICVHTYDVFPLSERCGIVQMIPRTKTLYDIRQSGVSLLNYIMSSNEELNVKTLRERIVASTAGACLLAFTMGLGDRHLENILVSSDALLVHVDFGYIFGEDPKRQRTQMRITDEMIDALGGKGSATFSSFVEKTQLAYSEMRLHTSFWYHLLASEHFIVGDPRRHWKRIRDHTLNRFVPGEDNTEASVQIESVVRTATRETWFQSLVDMTHSASNQMTGIFHMEL